MRFGEKDYNYHTFKMDGYQFEELYGSIQNHYEENPRYIVLSELEINLRKSILAELNNPRSLIHKIFPNIRQKKIKIMGKAEKGGGDFGEDLPERFLHYENRIYWGNKSSVDFEGYDENTFEPVDFEWKRKPYYPEEDPFG
jgi:hypothetical protein